MSHLNSYQINNGIPALKDNDSDKIKLEILKIMDLIEDLKKRGGEGK